MIYLREGSPSCTSRTDVRETPVRGRTIYVSSRASFAEISETSLFLEVETREVENIS